MTTETQQPKWLSNLYSRTVPLDDIYIRSGGDGRTVVAYAAVFDSPVQIRDQDGHYLEVNSRSAFDKSIRERSNRFGVFYNHGKTLYGSPSERGSMPLGAPMEVRPDARGLLTVTRYNRTPLADEVLEAINSGSLRGMSYTGSMIKSDPARPPYLPRSNGDLITVTRQEIALLEYGPTPIPAYDEAEIVGVRNQDLDGDGDESAETEQEGNGVARAVARLADRPDEQQPAGDPGSSDTGEGETTPPAAEEGTPEADGTTAAPSTEAAARSEGAAPSTDEPRKHSEVNHDTTRSTTVNDRTTADSRMTVEERAARQSEIRARLAEIDTEYSGAALPDDIQHEWDELNTEHDEHARAVQAANDRRDKLRVLADQQDGTSTGERRGMHDVLVAPRKPDNIYDLTEIRQRARSIDELPHLYRDNAMRAIELAKFPATKREDAQTQVERLLNTIDDDGGTLARRVLATGSPIYDRAFGKAVLARSTVGLTGEEQRSLSLGTNSEGGFAVPFQLDPTVILTSDGSINPLRQIARIEQIVGKEWQGVTSGGITVSRSAEGAEATDDSPTLAQPTVRPTRVLGFVPFSIEIDQDWTRLRAEITRLLNEAKDDEEASSFVTGNGTDPNPSGVVSTLAAGSEVSEQTAASFSVDDLYAVEEAVPPRFRPRSRWLANKTIYNEIRAFSTGSDGGDLWVRLGAGQPNELLGYPAHESSEMAVRGTADNRYLLFGDFSQFLIVDRVGMMVEITPHLFGATNRFPTGQRGIVAVWRNSSLVLVDNAFRVLVDGTT